MQWWKNIDCITHRKQGKHEVFDPDILNLQFAQRCEFAKGETREPYPNFDMTGAPPPFITLTEIEQALKTCKRTSPGPSELPHFVFRDFWMILATHYWYVWNLSLEKGNFPQSYKRANIHAIPKMKNAKEIKQLRGVSVTSISARLFEKVVYRRWIAENICVRGDPFQFAYKRSLSTIDYLLTLQYLVLKHLDNSDIDGVHVVAVDFAMAFDKVNQEIACRQYRKFIDSPYIQRWLYNFTIERTQRLAWRGQYCNYLPIDRGCAQGTVCGPSIFSMLTDDMTCLNPKCYLLKYSDDMSCVVPCPKNPSDSETERLREELSNFCKQAGDKGLCINHQKTKQIRFCLNYRPDCKCSTMSPMFSEEMELRVLGVTFQRNCLFTHHTKKLLSNLRSLLYLFKDLRIKRVSSEDISKIFDALIVSRIRYAISVYACDTNALKKIDTFLEKCYSRNYTSKRILVTAILKAEDHRLMTNILCNPRHPLHAVLHAQRKTRTTRHNFFGVKPKTNTTIFMKSFCNRVLTM